MRVRVFKQKKGLFKVLLTSYRGGEVRVKLLPAATRKELQATLPREVREIAGGRTQGFQGELPLDV